MLQVLIYMMVTLIYIYLGKLFYAHTLQTPSIDGILSFWA